MSATVKQLTTASLHSEWQRVEVLAQCLLRSRAGQPLDEQLINQLQQLHQQVRQLRLADNSPWRTLNIAGLDELGLDILACILAAEARPTIGWMYQELQPGKDAPYASLPLLQQLLALDDNEFRQVQHLLGEQGLLFKSGLLEVDCSSQYGAIRPVPSLVPKLMDWPEPKVVPEGAYRVRGEVHWDDLVLPADRQQALREFMLWIKHRDKVVNEWGAQTVGGPLALFSGPSGTGKTFAAAVIATELGWPLYRVDLARLVSKYIGETEKNIGRLFDAAHGQNMILQFDEVDSLLSKRGEIKEARDRYANMEVSYLLARVEEHRGPCILTTNLRSQIDKAFARRFQMVVEFPRPDTVAREQLWRRMLPPRAPLAEEVDLQQIAAAVNLTGGNIRNAALHAAYLAAEHDRPITTRDIAVGIYRELGKDKAQLQTRELGALAIHLPSELSSGGQQ